MSYQQRAQEMLPHLDRHIQLLEKFHDTFVKIASGELSSEFLAKGHLATHAAEFLAYPSPSEMSKYVTCSGEKPQVNKGYLTMADLTKKILAKENKE